MRTGYFIALALGATLASTDAVAQSSDDHGSAILQTKRNCPASATTPCNGSGTGQGVVQRGSAGGSGQAASNTFTATGTGVGSTAFGSVAFGQLGFPEIKASVNAVGDVRVGNNIYAYQTYTYTGQDEFDLLLAANFHIVDSSTDVGAGSRPGGALTSAGFAIWNREDFFTYAGPDFAGNAGFSTAASLYNQSYLFGQDVACDGYSDYTGGPGPRAVGSATRSLSGGEANLGVSQQNCGEETLTLYRGEQFVVASYAQLIANRNGFIDATGTFTLGLDPAGGEANIAAFRNGVVLGAVAVAEPATWACMIMGFGVVGGALRRRPRGAIRAAG